MIQTYLRRQEKISNEQPNFTPKDIRERRTNKMTKVIVKKELLKNESRNNGVEIERTMTLKPGSLKRQN